LPNPSSQGLIKKQPTYCTPLCKGLVKEPSQPFWRLTLELGRHCICSCMYCFRMLHWMQLKCPWYSGLEKWDSIKKEKEVKDYSNAFLYISKVRMLWKPTVVRQCIVQCRSEGLTGMCYADTYCCAKKLREI